MEATLKGNNVQYQEFSIREDKVAEIVIRNVLEIHSEKMILDELTRLVDSTKNVYRIECAVKCFFLAVMYFEWLSYIVRIFQQKLIIGVDITMVCHGQNLRLTQFHVYMTFDHHVTTAKPNIMTDDHNENNIA